jgi:circadian clock protein KaiC
VEKSRVNQAAGRIPLVRVRTGVPGLDDLLGGGILEGDAALVVGAPGTGKTSVGMEFLYTGVTEFDQPGIFITFEEFAQQIYRDALAFGWDLRRLEDEDRLRVMLTSPDLLQQDLQRQDGLLAEMIHEVGAKRVVVDSVTHFRRLVGETTQYREMVYGVVNALKRERLTALLLHEACNPEEIGIGCEEYVADTVIALSRELMGDDRLRFIEVVKSRGSRHVPTRCLFVIDDTGPRVIPAHSTAVFPLQEAVSTGVSALDDLLGGGIPHGAFYLLELDPDLQCCPFQNNFLREALETEDVFIEVADRARRFAEWEEAARRMDFTEALTRAREQDRLHLLVPGGPGEEIDTTGAATIVPAEDLARTVEAIAERAAPGCNVRLVCNLSSVAASMEEGAFFPMFDRLLDTSRRVRGIFLGSMDPKAFDERSHGRLLAAADGVIRAWTDGAYDFLQAARTAHGVRSPVHVFRAIPQPPFVEIISR